MKPRGNQNLLTKKYRNNNNYDDDDDDDDDDDEKQENILFEVFTSVMSIYYLFIYLLFLVSQRTTAAPIQIIKIKQKYL